METISADANEFSNEEIFGAFETSDLETLNMALAVLGKNETSLSEAKLSLSKLFFEEHCLSTRTSDQRVLKAIVS
jgi:hypothetical protein